MDQSKEIQQLERRISELENKLKKDDSSLSMFGRSYSQVGSANSDFLIKTKGQIKIQWGSKFIDLIKDGKINVDARFIYKDKQVGTKDGLYVLGEGDEIKVVLVSGGQQIDLKGEIGTTYVSFLGEQETSSEAKSTALRNIGFLYRTIQEVDSNSILNGIIYIEDQKKLYIVQGGALSEYSIDIPNPYTKQFVIAKTDNEEGALVIRGAGKQNSILFDSMSIYTDTSGSYIDSNGDTYIKVLGSNKVLIGTSKIVFSDTVYSQKFYSEEATNSYGFRLYMESGLSTLEVDNLVVRKALNQQSSKDSVNPPQKWYFNNNIIGSVQEVEEDSIMYFKFTLLYTNSFSTGDNLYVYVPLKATKEGSNDIYLMAFQVSRIDEDLDNVIYVRLSPSYTDSTAITIYNSDINSITSALSLQTLFFVGNSSGKKYVPKVSKQGFQIIETQSFLDEQNVQKVTSRIGELTELGLKYKNLEEVIDVEGYGLYSKLAIFKEAKYTHDYNLPVGDNSSNFASTEWVNKVLPVGSIIMFGSSTSKIPEGWSICDGTNGTPNLVGRFVKAVGKDSSAGVISSDLNESNELTIKQENLPIHSHPHKAHTHTGSLNPSSISTSESGNLSMDLVWNDYNWNLKTTQVEVVTSVLGVTTMSATIGSVSSYQTKGGSTSGGNHSHTVPLSGVATTINSTTSQEETLSSVQWPNKPIKIEPRAYALIFIMRIK